MVDICSSGFMCEKPESLFFSVRCEAPLSSQPITAAQVFMMSAVARCVLYDLISGQFRRKFCVLCSRRVIFIQPVSTDLKTANSSFSVVLQPVKSLRASRCVCKAHFFQLLTLSYSF
ncbi:hypothetical protein GOODEAATRI_001218 [Goodea atripinnis]|uniref:Uncharacterized protein n=1 Tax=Goodea atripinnis TaxID=208336 RepID=A0ABV0PAE5_9TELE